jgi:hypothetical protein
MMYRFHFVILNFIRNVSNSKKTNLYFIHYQHKYSSTAQDKFYDFISKLR